MAFEKLKQDGVITVKVINFTDAADEADKEKWALDFFKQNLLQQWFQPTLAPVTFDASRPEARRRPEAPRRTVAPRPPAAGRRRHTPSGGDTHPVAAEPAGGGPPAAAAHQRVAAPRPAGADHGRWGTSRRREDHPQVGGAPTGGGARRRGRRAGGAPAGGAARPAAGSHHTSRRCHPTSCAGGLGLPLLETAGRQPAGSTSGSSPRRPATTSDAQAADSDQVTLTFLGGGAPPTVRVDGRRSATPSARSSWSPGGSTRHRGRLPAAAADQEFRLFFDFDKPRHTGWTVARPPRRTTAISPIGRTRSTPLSRRSRGGAEPGC